MKLENISPYKHFPAVFVLGATAFGLTSSILWGTLWPTGSPQVVNISVADKLWHMMAFGIWAKFLVARWLARGWKVLEGAAFAGTMIELVQPQVERDAEMVDPGDNILRAAQGVWSAGRLFFWLTPRRQDGGTVISAST